MTRLKNLLLCCLLSLPASACGLKGPLYLPGAETPAPRTTPEATTEEDEEPEDEGRDAVYATHP